MVAYNFKAEFAGAVESGRKRSTLRPVGKRRHADHDSMLELYTGMRTKACRLLRRTICTSSHRIVFVVNRNGGAIIRDGARLPPSRLRRLAELDGFESFAAMVDWFRDQYGNGRHDLVRITWI